jgi:CRISPR-associated endoribonuclease Cas6
MISRISLEFEAVNGDKILLPKNFSYLLQSFVYELGREGDLHGRVYNSDSKNYHLFVYSPLMGEHKFYDGKHEFKSPVRLYFSSPVEDFCMAVAEKVLKRSEYKIGNQTIKIKSIMPVKEPEFKEEMYFRALSPVTVHKTLENEGRKKTVYLNPDEEEFRLYLIENIKRKYFALYEKDCDVSIEPFKIQENDFKVLLYEKDKEKPFVIKGWNGIYKIKGDIEMIKFTYRSGIGSRNSQGFGFIEAEEQK